MVASERALTSILEVLLAELLGDVVVVLAESAAVAVVVVAPEGGVRPPWEPRLRDRGGGGQEGAPGGGGGGAAQRERHGSGACGAVEARRGRCRMDNRGVNWENTSFLYSFLEQHLFFFPLPLFFLRESPPAASAGSWAQNWAC